MKSLILITTAIMMNITSVDAQNLEIMLFPDGAPNETQTFIEYEDSSGSKLSGATINRMHNVSSPMITIYKADLPIKGNKTVIVVPGGGYHILAYDLEGVEICKMLNKNGINAVLLKYRVPRREGREKHEAPLEDIQRAISILRYRADEIGVNSHNIGVMGFSAGAHLSVMASTLYGKRSYLKVDECDTVSVRPDFCVLIYPAYLSGEHFKLASDIVPTIDTPPTFIAQTQDDAGYIDSSIFYYYALKELDVAVTMHLYPEGGHGYGLRDTGHLVNSWPDRLVEWIDLLD